MQRPDSAFWWCCRVFLTLCLFGLLSIHILSETPISPWVSGPAERELLLNPRSIPSNSSSEPLEQIRAAFSDPPADFRSMPLWVWNDELEWPRLKEQLAQFKQQGMGGVFVHPRPGLMTEYLGSDWFRLWKLTMEEGKRLGLSVNIYDENSYPAGFSGGYVPSQAPDTAAQFVQAEAVRMPRDINFAEAELVSAFAVEKTEAGDVISARRILNANGLAENQVVFRFRLRRASGNPWTAGFPYVDLTNPQTASVFLKTTYEPYKNNVGNQFGQTVKWAFDDEPLLATGGAYDAAPLALPLSRNTLAEFQNRCGYDLADHLPSLYWDIGEFQKVRFDYWQTLHDLWKENYFRPLFQWCDKNNLQFTGHWMEHEWPFPWITPADASLYAYEHVPGIDMLEGSGIRTSGSDPHMLFTIKQVASVSHQLGRRAFCEAYGVSGWDSTFEHYKRFGDWLMVHGINFMNQHLSFATVRGARKRDHPQSFSDISPWWPYYQLHGDYLGRLSYLLTRGTSRNRLLLLEPTTGGFLLARRGGATPELERLRLEYSSLIQFLADHQVDFDLADEYILEWFGKADGKSMRVGKATYDLLVWPPGMDNLRHQSLPLLQQYLEAGGEVLALSPPAKFVDGRECEEARALANRYASQWHTLSGLPDLLAQVYQRLKPLVGLDRPLRNVGLLTRYLENGDRLLFFANTGLSLTNARLTLDGGDLERWNPVTGRISAAAYRVVSPGKLQLELSLPPAGSEMLLVKKAPGSAKPRGEVTRFEEIPLGRFRNSPDSLNVAVLDYCDFQMAGRELLDLNTWKANWTLWQGHGFERPAWDNAVQFKTRIFDRGPFSTDSGFDAVFRFLVSDTAVLPGLELAVENPELYSIRVNGTLVSFSQANRWLDPRIRSAPIAGLAKAGENIVKISGHPFDVRMELENIYLRGRFSVSATGKGFELVATHPLNLGSWAKQGLPFYSGSVLYETEIQAPEGASSFLLELREWEGSLVEVTLDGQRVGLLAWPPYSAEFPAATGKHTVGVRVVSTPRNLFGPFHNPAKLRMKAWPAAWAEFPEHQPAGRAYDVLDYGLMQPPRISLGRSGN